MRIIGLLCVSWALVVEAGIAGAEGPPTPARGPAEDSSHVRVALGGNSPLLWQNDDSLAASLYVGVSRRHAIRVNVASYKDVGNLVWDVAGTLAGGDGVEHSERTTDLGIGWVIYPLRVCDGFMVELGGLRRTRHARMSDPESSPESVGTDTIDYAGRALIGWSWVLGRYGFIAVAGGVSYGRETGTETSGEAGSAPMTRKTISRMGPTNEGYLRIGVLFDL